jgi:hypothetical protein
MGFLFAASKLRFKSPTLFSRGSVAPGGARGTD